MTPSLKQRTALATKLSQGLFVLYPHPKCALNHKSAFELAVATILSAQCTDERVNLVTKNLFKKYRSQQAFADAQQRELEQDIKSTGFFRNKAKNIIGFAQAIVNQHGGKIPRDLVTLIKLPGVGRKTANVILGTAFGIASGVVVDTHVTRLSKRMGLTSQTDPVKIEQDLMILIPQEHWINFSHAMIWHGRKFCMARKPNCEECPLAFDCPKIGL
jgi:endonuclease-3